jgi:hypothetical protein
MQPQQSTAPDLQNAVERTRAIHIIASSLFRELISHGYSPSHVIDLTSELLELLTTSIRSAGDKTTECVVTTLREHLMERP